MTGERFRAYVAQILVPTFSRAIRSSWTTSALTKPLRVRRPIEAAGGRLLYLPPYSPEFNPIELAFAD